MDRERVSLDGSPESVSGSATEMAATAQPVPRLRRPELVVFVSSACIMTLELVAGRIIAPYVGVSLYTWTSVIGVVLAGISLGNYLGGWLADRRASLHLLGLIFVLAGLAGVGVLAADLLGEAVPGEWPVVARILVTIVGLFFVPCVILGMISPVVAKLAVRDLRTTGSTMGRIYGAGSVGSIVGTFATGFVLISWFGTHMIVWGVVLLLVIMGLLFLLRGPWLLLAMLVLGGATALVSHQEWLRGPCTRETNYFCIKVRETEREGAVVRVLTLDRLVHSYSSLDDPTRLIYDYEKMYAEVAAYRARQDDHLRVLSIGGGGYTFPRYMEAVYPDSDLDVIEIDPGVTEVAHDYLGLSRSTRISISNEDARLFFERQPDRPYDLIVGDAFNDFSVPYHLTTREFNERVRAWLADDGLYVVNLVDGPRANFLRSVVHTLRQTFAHVYVAPAIEAWRESPRSTFVILSSDQALDQVALRGLQSTAMAPLLANQMLSDDEVDGLLAEGRKVVLTDRYAPVDQMLAAVVREEVP